MKALADAGFPQAVIPPQERPNVAVLRQLGFSGTDEQVVEKRGRRRRTCSRRQAPPLRCGSPTRQPSRRQPIRWMAKST